MHSHLFGESFNENQIVFSAIANNEHLIVALITFPGWFYGVLDGWHLKIHSTVSSVQKRKALHLCLIGHKIPIHVQEINMFNSKPQQKKNILISSIIFNVHFSSNHRKLSFRFMEHCAECGRMYGM